MSVTQYTTTALIQARLSSTGVSLRIDDNLTVMTDIIDRASIKVDTYCRARYEPALMASNDWVISHASTIGAVLLCRRRGNNVPRSIQDEYDETMEELKAVAAGTLNIPGLAERREAAPVLSNVHTQLRPHPHTVVDRDQSTGKAEGYHRHLPADDGLTPPL